MDTTRFTSRTRSRLAALVLVASLAAGAAAGSIDRTSAQSPPLLVFASDRAPDYNPEVYSVELAGGVPRNLSRDLRSDRVVALNGSQVVFESDRSRLALYTTRVGSQAPVRRLLSLPSGTVATSVTGSWSPSGSVLAVALTEYGKTTVTYEIELVGRSGRSLARLVDAVPNAHLLAPSMWSADGARLAYSVGPPGELHHTIRIVDARGRPLVTRHGDEALWAQAAPRLAIISGAFSENRATQGSTVVDDEQGRQIRRFAGRALALSPDGRTLVLLRAGADWLASVDTGKLRRLPSGGAASISPDGEHVELQSSAGAVILGIPSGRVESHLTGLGSWLADSRRLAFVGTPQQGTVTIETIGGHVLRRTSLPLDGGFLDTSDVTQDGKSLVYTKQSSPVHQLYELLPSGDLRKLTRGLADHRDPAPSPDGRLLADAEFDTPCGNCFPPRIGVLGSDGSAPAQILPGQIDGNSHPSWSPDGTHIAYGENAAPDILGVFVMGADGSQPVALSAGSGASEPSWAPDGTAIAAARNGIIAMASDGTSAQQLTDPLPAGSDPALTHAPAWSPDSARLAFAGADGLHVMGRDGGGLRQIVAMRRISSVAWSPDGSLIAFAAACQSSTANCRNNPAHDVWTVGPDGSGLRQITTDVADDTTPAWLPATG